MSDPTPAHSPQQPSEQPAPEWVVELTTEIRARFHRPLRDGGKPERDPLVAMVVASFARQSEALEEKCAAFEELVQEVPRCDQCGMSFLAAACGVGHAAIRGILQRPALTYRESCQREAARQQAEARLAALERERDEALMLAEGPSTLKDLAAMSFERGLAVQVAEARLAEAAKTAATALDLMDSYKIESERLQSQLAALTGKDAEPGHLHREVLARASELMDASEGTSGACELNLLTNLVQFYERDVIPPAPQDAEGAPEPERLPLGHRFMEVPLGQNCAHDPDVCHQPASLTMICGKPRAAHAPPAPPDPPTGARCSDCGDTLDGPEHAAATSMSRSMEKRLAIQQAPTGATLSEGAELRDLRGSLETGGNSAPSLSAGATEEQRAEAERSFYGSPPANFKAILSLILARDRLEQALGVEVTLAERYLAERDKALAESDGLRTAVNDFVELVPGSSIQALRAALDAYEQGLSPAERAVAERLEPCVSCGAEPRLVTDGSGHEMQVVHRKDCTEDADGR